MKKIIITYFILLAILTNGLGQSFVIKSDIDSLLIGEPMYIKVTLQDSSLNGIIWPNFIVGDSLGDSFEILEVFEKDTITTDKNILSQKLSVTSFFPGNKVLQPLVIQNGNKVITSNALNIKVDILKADTTQPIRDIKPIIAANITFKDRWGLFVKWIKKHWYIGVLGLLLLALAIWFLFIRKKKQVEEVIQEKVAPRIPEHIIAFNSLKKLEEEELWQKGNQKEYNYRLTNIIRSYITDRYRINAKGKTSNEILQEGKLVIGSQNRENLKRLLTLSDLVKFAKETPTEEENRKVMSDAVGFINTTRRND
jgi:ribosomal protein S18